MVLLPAGASQLKVFYIYFLTFLRYFLYHHLSRQKPSQFAFDTLKTERKWIDLYIQMVLQIRFEWFKDSKCRSSKELKFERSCRGVHLTVIVTNWLIQDWTHRVFCCCCWRCSHKHVLGESAFLTKLVNLSAEYKMSKGTILNKLACCECSLEVIVKYSMTCIYSNILSWSRVQRPNLNITFKCVWLYSKNPFLSWEIASKWGWAGEINKN